MDPGQFLLLPPPPTEYGSRKHFATTPPPPTVNPFGQNSVCPPKWMLARTPMTPPPTLNPPVCDNAALDAALHSIRRRRRVTESSGSESEMIVKVVICFTVEPLYLKHVSNHKLRIRHYIVLLQISYRLYSSPHRRQSEPSVLPMLGVAHIIFTGLNF